jgi:hypothetical protein
MFRHGPSKLTGPTSRENGLWENDEPSGPAESAESRESRPFRAALVERVRREIAEGTYDTPEKWEKALDRLLDRLEREE